MASIFEFLYHLRLRKSKILTVSTPSVSVFFLLCVTTTTHWRPRVKSAVFYYLDPEQQPPVGLLQLLLTALQLASVLLLLLQPPDVLHRGLEDGAFVPAHVAAERTNVEDNLLHTTPWCRQKILCNILGQKEMGGGGWSFKVFPSFYDMNKKWQITLRNYSSLDITWGPWMGILIE